MYVKDENNGFIFLVYFYMWDIVIFICEYFVECIFFDFRRKNVFEGCFIFIGKVSRE